MNNPSTALVLLTTQRHHLESRPDERAVARLWRMRVEAARAVGQVIVHVQWDGAPGTLGETFSRGWVHHPDFRVEERDLRVRARGEDAFAGSDLDTDLRRAGVRHLELLALPGAEVLDATAESARELGYGVTVPGDLPRVPPVRTVRDQQEPGA
ncbi:isochorismatase [Deinococcus hopiensis]|uniref:Nicotinamidase-related amidase n=1 Tax=Deinococcus hopiensis KR-140 TaxID=695939 RepID=A0A1W1VQJ2_9DEIO|nr:isochorismatase [Deinococcus hopiensis]SMB95619.1 Nicotinamidase-related amidase [Deinococcus hopiensis KR-140]